MPPCRPINLPQICSYDTPLAPTVPVAKLHLSRLYPAAQYKSRPMTDEHPKALLVESAGFVYIQARRVL